MCETNEKVLTHLQEKPCCAEEVVMNIRWMPVPLACLSQKTRPCCSEPQGPLAVGLLCLGSVQRFMSGRSLGFRIFAVHVGLCSGAEWGTNSHRENPPRSDPAPGPPPHVGVAVVYGINGINGVEANTDYSTPATPSVIKKKICKN